MNNNTNLTCANFDKLIIDSVDMVTGFDRSDESIVLMLDQVRDGTISNGVETAYGTGLHGIKLSAFDRSKTAKFTCTNGYVVASALAAQVGSELEAASQSNKFAVPYVEFLTVGSDNTVSLTYTASGSIPFIYKANKDRTQGEKYACADAASANEFAFDAATGKITLPTGGEDAKVFAAGDVVIVPYSREAAVGKKIANTGDNFSRSVRLVLDVTCHDICDQDVKYHTIIEFPNAKIDGNFDMAFGTEPMIHNFAAEAMIDPCAATNTLWNYYIA